MALAAQALTAFLHTVLGETDVGSPQPVTRELPGPLLLGKESGEQRVRVRGSHFEFPSWFSHAPEFEDRCAEITMLIVLEADLEPVPSQETVTCTCPGLL